MHIGRIDSPTRVTGESLRYSLSLDGGGGGGERAQVQNSRLIAQRGNKSSNQRISLNGSQCGGCSTEYDTLTSNQVVCK